MSYVEAERKYSEIQLQENGNPRWFQQRFAQIAAEYPDAKADDAKKIAIVLRAAPAKYQSVLATQQQIRGDSCTSDHLIETMILLYRQTQGSGNSDGSNNPGTQSEFGLAAPGDDTRRCFNCDQTGHIARDCPNRNAG